MDRKTKSKKVSRGLKETLLDKRKRQKKGAREWKMKDDRRSENAEQLEKNRSDRGDGDGNRNGH